jgi:predicted Zn-dependent protease
LQKILQEELLGSDLYIVENLYKKIIEIKPSSVLILKRISKWYIKLGRYSDAYTYITNAIKVDNKESELYELLAEYYKENNDTLKYYECCMKKLENLESYSTSSLLNELYSFNLL